MRASRIHLAATLAWALLAIPTVTVWHNSIVWVGLISVYANVVGHLGAWEAAKAKEQLAAVTAGDSTPGGTPGDATPGGASRPGVAG